jgi:hypothetical protein
MIKNDTTLNEARKEAFAEALENHNFGQGVDFVDHGHIEKDGDIWSTRCYLDDIDYDDTVEVSFTVWFKENRTEVEHTDHEAI